MPKTDKFNVSYDFSGYGLTKNRTNFKTAMKDLFTANMIGANGEQLDAAKKLAEDLAELIYQYVKTTKVLSGQSTSDTAVSSDGKVD